MPRSIIGWLAVSLILAGCGAPEEPAGNSAGIELLPGFAPTPPAAGQRQFVTPILTDIEAGTDITLCTYLDYQVDADFDIVGYKGFQSENGHHTILYGVDQKRPAGTHECDDNDMLGARYLGGGGTDGTISDQVIPEGIAFRVKTGTQLMMLSHWINTTGRTTSGQAAYNVTTKEPSPDIEVANLFTVVSTQIDLPVGAGSVHQECTLGQDFKFFVIGGHAHEYATHITIGHTPVGGKAKAIYDTEWGPELIFDTPLNQYPKDAPLEMKAGDKFTVDCSYANTTPKNLLFPKEMCVGYGYFFPATQEIDCVDEVWPSP